jgi:hypothetical protein
MKTKLAPVIATTLLASLGSALAGTPPVAPAPPPPVEESPFSAELSVGYDTFYIFRGEELFEQVVWGQVEMSYALTDTFSVSLTPWYLSAIDDDYTELNILPSLTWDAGFAEITAGYAGYVYPRGSWGGNEGIDDEHEANLGLSRSFGILEAGLFAAYNFDREATYLEASVGTSFELGSAVSLETSAAIGYSADYYGVDGFTHVLLTVALPVQLTETATLTPYIAGNLPLEVLNDFQDNEVFGGVALAVSF